MSLLPNRFTLTLISAALALTLTACGDKEDKKVATQVAAKVGSEEISVHQINQVLSRNNNKEMTPEAGKILRREILEKLIDQQLAVDQAMESKLHRSPEVVSQIEAARQEILARAFLQKLISAVPKPTPEELRAYYAAHPQLFAQRRIFNVQEIAVPATANVTEQLRGYVSAPKSLESAAAWLKSKDIKFGANSVTRPAEQVPMELLEKIHPLKDGQSMLIETNQGVTLLRIVSSQSAPVSEALALPRIEQFLVNQRANEAVTSRVKDLRAHAKISYMGEFVKDETAVSAPVVAPAASSPSAEDKTKSAIEKGIAGLK